MIAQEVAWYKVPAVGRFVIVAGLIGSASMRTATNPCGPSDGAAANMISYNRGIVSGRDTVSARWRQSFKLPATTADSVVLVTDTALCRRARTLYIRLMASDTIRTPMVYVVRVGPSRYVFGDSKVYGQHTWDVVADTSFAALVFLMD